MPGAPGRGRVRTRAGQRPPPTMFSLTAAGLFRSTRTGSGVTASATFPAVSRAVTFRWTLWVGKLAGSFHGYDPVFGSRLATPELDPRLSAVTTGVHGPF